MNGSERKIVDFGSYFVYLPHKENNKGKIKTTGTQSTFVYVLFVTFIRI